MWYKIEYNKLVVLLLPTTLRKAKLTAFSQCLVYPISQLHYSWTLLRNDNLYKVAHNAQVCKFRKALNDRFDQIERRIYIGDGQNRLRKYLYTTAENKPVYLGMRYLYLRDEYADTGLDFIVYVPQSIIDIQSFELKALIEFYKLGGTRYKIQAI